MCIRIALNFYIEKNIYITLQRGSWSFILSMSQFFTNLVNFHRHIPFLLIRPFCNIHPPQIICPFRLCLRVWRGWEGKALAREKYRGKLRNLSHFLKECFFRE